MIEVSHKKEHPIGSKISKTRNITAEPSYHAQVWEYHPCMPVWTACLQCARPFSFTTDRDLKSNTLGLTFMQTLGDIFSLSSYLCIKTSVTYFIDH